MSSFKPACDLHAAAAKVLTRQLHHRPDIDKQLKKICRPLVYSEDMRQAWKRLEAVSSRWATALGLPPDAVGADFPARHFLVICGSLGREFRSRPRLAAREHRERYEHISRTARDLAASIDGDQSLLRGFAHFFVDVQAMVDHLDNYLAQRGWTLPESRSDLRTAVSPGVTLMLETLPFVPDASEILRRIAQRADEVAKLGTETDRPRKITAMRTFFIRRLSSELHALSGTRLHSVVAAAATAVFDETIDCWAC